MLWNFNPTLVWFQPTSQPRIDSVTTRFQSYISLISTMCCVSTRSIVIWFQSYISLISTKSSVMLPADTSYFNPTLVWFQQRIRSIREQYRTHFNPTLVWFQHILRTRRICFLHHFNPTLVWFQLYFTYTILSASWTFQSYISLISTRLESKPKCARQKEISILH